MLKRLLIVGGLVFSHATMFFAGRIVGEAIGSWGVLDRRFEHERTLIEPVLDADPAFSSVEVAMSSYDGSAYLSGEVRGPPDLDSLRSEMLRIFGESRINDLIYAVSIRGDTSSPALRQAL